MYLDIVASLADESELPNFNVAVGGQWEFRLGYKKSNLRLNCIAFADDYNPFCEYRNNSKTNQLLKEIVLQSNLSNKSTFGRDGITNQPVKRQDYKPLLKRGIMKNIEDSPMCLKKIYGKIEQVSKFNYLGEIIQPNA